MRALTTGVLIAAVVLATACRPVLPRSARLVLSGVAIGTGAVIIAGAPSNCASDDPDELLGEIACSSARTTMLTFGISLVATGLLAMVIAGRESPEAAAPPAAQSPGDVAAKLHARARDDARGGRCDRALVLIGSLSKRHPEYRVRIADDPVLRPCL